MQRTDLVTSKIKGVGLGNWIFFKDAAVMGEGEGGTTVFYYNSEALLWEKKS